MENASIETVVEPSFFVSFAWMQKPGVKIEPDWNDQHDMFLFVLAMANLVTSWVDTRVIEE